MKKQPLFVILLLSIFLFSSCDDKTETVDDRWKIENETQFNTIANNPEYTKLNSLTGNGFIMYKVLETGTGDRAPAFNEEVKALHYGWYKNIWTKPDTFTDDKGNFITNKIEFNTTYRNRVETFNVMNRIEGFRTALQYMKEGDKWEVWMPWILGYGPSTSGAIKGYSTLVFEIELVEILNK